ncbi:MAG: hypothetical protein ACLT8E_05685 [Akkermansia sp.]
MILAILAPGPPTGTAAPSRAPAHGSQKEPFVNKSPEGSEQWLTPWVELKYFTYNPAVFPRMLGSVSGEIAPGSLVHVYDKNGNCSARASGTRPAARPCAWCTTGRTPYRAGPGRRPGTRREAAGRFCAWMKPPTLTACRTVT